MKVALSPTLNVCSVFIFFDFWFSDFLRLKCHVVTESKGHGHVPNFFLIFNLFIGKPVSTFGNLGICPAEAEDFFFKIFDVFDFFDF